jgi:hypothetical protein
MKGGKSHIELSIFVSSILKYNTAGGEGWEGGK